MDDIDKIYQRIGEFVVCFQWLENRFREIGWLILDPNRIEWPPKSLRNESNQGLLNKVESLFIDLIGSLDIKDTDKRRRDFSEVVAGCHEMRKYRNNLLHSAFIELKGGGEVVAIVRSNPKLKYDPSSGEPQFDREVLSEAAILDHMKALADLTVLLNLHYTQLIHWAPFDRKRKMA